MRIQGNTDPAVVPVLHSHSTLHSSSRNSRRTIYWIIAGALLFFAFLKIPITTLTHDRPQSWEAVLVFAFDHHLQWGRDLIFTYGPLGFLTNDYYWGTDFWLILAWSVVFSGALTCAALHFLKRLPLALRVTVCLVLPLFSIPHNIDLGIDPIYYLAITLFTTACLPGEQPGFSRLIGFGCLLGLLSLFKFTFCLYSLLGLCTIAFAFACRKQPLQPAVILASAFIAFLSGWLFAGQNLSNLGSWFHHSWQITSGYAAAMAIPPNPLRLVFGVFAAASLTTSLLLHWRGSAGTASRSTKLIILAAGTFLAWKEGFVRADYFHNIVFFVYAAMLTFLVPAILPVPPSKNRWTLRVTVAALVVICAGLSLKQFQFFRDIRALAIPGVENRVTAVVAPTHYRRLLEVALANRRQTARLPRIAAIAGNSSMDVLGWNQDFALLNDLNYRLHPVFQDYSAYTPELQRLNSGFFDSSSCPEFILWNYAPIDDRFPALEDGQILLSVLAYYTPVCAENDFVLWQRNAPSGAGYHLENAREVIAVPGEWVTLPQNALWLKIGLHATLLNSIRGFFFQPAQPQIEIRLAGGKTAAYSLIPAKISTGFIINPMLDPASGLMISVTNRVDPSHITAIRVQFPAGTFSHTITFTMQNITGVPILARGFTTPSP